MIPTLKLIERRALVPVAPTMRPPIFDLVAYTQMSAATDGIGDLATRAQFEIPLLVERIKKIGEPA